MSTEIKSRLNRTKASLKSASDIHIMPGNIPGTCCPGEIQEERGSQVKYPTCIRVSSERSARLRRIADPRTPFPFPYHRWLFFLGGLVRYVHQAWTQGKC